MSGREYRSIGFRSFGSILACIIIMVSAACIPAAAIPETGVQCNGEMSVKMIFSPGEITNLSVQAEERAKAALDAIAAIPPEERTPGNTLVAFDSAITDYNDAMTPMVLAGYLSPDPAVAEEGMAAKDSQTAFFAGVYTRSDLYETVKDQVPETEHGLRLYEVVTGTFRRNGPGLPGEKLSNVREMKTKLGALETEFNANLNNDDTTVLFGEDELEGLSPGELAAFSRNKDGQYIVRLSNPASSAVLSSAENEETRKRMYVALKNVQADKNLGILSDALVLRSNIAAELGYPTWADYMLYDRMAGSKENVMDFLCSLIDPLSEKKDEEIARLLELKQEIDPSATEIFPWDLSYLQKKYLRQNFDYDESSFREYYPAGETVEGILETTGTVFGVEFSEIAGAPVWDPSVRAFEVVNASDRRTIGYLYVDLYPREGKFGDYACMQVISGREKTGGYSLPVAVITGELNPPQAGSPQTLSLYEIESVFHETGHSMHMVLTESSYGILSGANVAWDFCETPSQALEEWAYDPGVLESISSHYITGEKIPAELVEKAIAARYADIGLLYSTQLAYSLQDMYYHTAELPVDTTAIWYDVYGETVGLRLPEGIHPEASFSHIMDEYDAGYYGYIWSKVYALEIVEEFKENGMTNRTLGLKLREDIYSKGNTEDGMTILENFLGREPGVESLYIFLGLEPGDQKAPVYNIQYPFYDGISIL